LNHPTTQSQENQDNRWAALSLSFWREILADFHPRNFAVPDLESLREHYALTLRHRTRRLEARHEEERRFTDETTYRAWRLFMSGAAHQFESCETNVYQALFVKPHQGKSGFPLTRNDWYQ
jgi:cyclopropane-fatty-acyl-phospholipid synthase